MPLMVPHGARVQPFYLLNLQSKVLVQELAESVVEEVAVAATVEDVGVTSTVSLLVGSFKVVVDP